MLNYKLILWGFFLLDIFWPLIEKVSTKKTKIVAAISCNFQQYSGILQYFSKFFNCFT